MQLQIDFIIRKIRRDHPTMGLESMYYKIRDQLIGRDRFISICQELGYSIQSKRNYRRTTDSSGVIRFPNLILDITVKAINQVWVSDITYYEMNGRFYYLTFITDMYSRFIKGYSVSPSLRTEGTTITALKRALKQFTPEKELIFHSDGGGQYYSKEFLSITAKHSMRNSMAKEVYENPMAESLNHVIKNKYLYVWKPKTLSRLIKLVDRAVSLYNYEKPHTSLNMSTPSSIEFINTFAIGQTASGEESSWQTRQPTGHRAPKVAGQTAMDSDVSQQMNMKS
jgi:putative transposase